MTKKKHPSDQYHLPPHVAKEQRLAAMRAVWMPCPELPQRRLILGIFGIFLLGLVLSLALWLPPHFLLRDLRARGITVAAVVTGVDNKPKYVKVRLAQGPKSGTEVKLGDYAGMYPDTQTGDIMLVTYDPKNPSRSLSHSWVIDPPFNVPAYGISALTTFFLTGTVVMTLRRRILRTHVSRSAPSEPA
ncbi:hypothetical protein GCM10027073_11180 [Streptomyces chlorus]|uniref:DUF3592 domain-containing protein n=1 Tax=Streptomyces chlorus TaxID=887452 RepID=A0ABW1DST3_9ACTN